MASNRGLRISQALDDYIEEGIYEDGVEHTIAATTHGLGTNITVEFQKTSSDGTRWTGLQGEYYVNKTTGDVFFTPRSRSFNGRIIINKLQI